MLILLLCKAPPGKYESIESVRICINRNYHHNIFYEFFLVSFSSSHERDFFLNPPAYLSECWKCNSIQMEVLLRVSAKSSHREKSSCADYEWRLLKNIMNSTFSINYITSHFTIVAFLCYSCLSPALLGWGKKIINKQKREKKLFDSANFIALLRCSWLFFCLPRSSTHLD